MFNCGQKMRPFVILMVENNKQGSYISVGEVAFDFSYVGLKPECDCQLCKRFKGGYRF